MSKYESPVVADMTGEPRVPIAVAVVAGAKAVASVAGQAIAAGAVAAGAYVGNAAIAKVIGK